MGKYRPELSRKKFFKNSCVFGDIFSLNCNFRIIQIMRRRVQLHDIKRFYREIWNFYRSNFL